MDLSCSTRRVWFVECSFNKDLDTAGVAHQTHLFLEGENAPAADVATIIDRVYKENQATILVASRSNKVTCDLGWVRVVLILASVV